MALTRSPKFNWLATLYLIYHQLYIYFSVYIYLYNFVCCRTKSNAAISLKKEALRGEREQEKKLSWFVWRKGWTRKWRPPRRRWRHPWPLKLIVIFVFCLTAMFQFIFFFRFLFGWHCVCVWLIWSTEGADSIGQVLFELVGVTGAWLVRFVNEFRHQSQREGRIARPEIMLF